VEGDPSMSANLAPSAGQPRLARIALVALFAAGQPLGVAVIYFTWWRPWSWLGVALTAFTPMVAARLATRFFHSAEMRPAMRRYSNRLVVTMAVYFVTLVATTELYRRGLGAGPLGYVLAILPAAPVVGIFLLLARYFREETDEVMRSVVMTSLVWSGAATFCEATVWGFLATFGKAPHLWMWAVPVAFFAQFGVTGPLAGRRLR
jgi:hypothetical protein